MKRTYRMVAGVVAGLMLSGCYGPFYLVRKVHKFNGEVSDNKWIVELVYLVCTWAPVYAIAGLADSLIFNSIEFWTGNNPLAATSADARGVTASKRIARDGSETIFNRIATPAGDQLVIEQFRDGQLTTSVRFQREGNATVARDGSGALVFTAQTLPDGKLVITDASGRQVASYTAQERQRISASIRQ